MLIQLVSALVSVLVALLVFVLVTVFMHRDNVAQPHSCICCGLCGKVLAYGQQLCKACKKIVG